MNKRIFLIIFTLFVLLTGTHSVLGLAQVKDNINQYDKLQQNILRQSKEYAESEYLSECKLIWEDKEFGLEGDYRKAKLGKPFFIYEPDLGDCQIPAFTFPIYYQGECVCLMETALYEETWTSTMSSDNCQVINDIDYQNQEFLFYYCGGQIKAESEKETIVYNITIDERKTSSIEKTFAQKSFSEKLTEICKNTEKFSNIQDDKESLLQNEQTQTNNNINKKTEQKKKKISIYYFIWILVVIGGGIVILKGIIKRKKVSR